MQADLTGELKLDSLMVGSYRIQLATSPDFGNVMFDKVYSFFEDHDTYVDIVATGMRDGRYWVHFAFIDLLETQHPFTAPRMYSYRRPRPGR
jgi:hypothetical protein